MKKPKPKPTAKKPRPAKAKPAKVAKGHNSENRTFDELRESFLGHRSAWAVAQAKMKTATKLLAEVVATAKADGFTKKELVMADTLTGLGGEATIKAEVTTRLRVARFLGLAMGNQMDLFAEPDRTPAVDQARDDGKMASMEDAPCKPPYAPNLPQYKAWMDGYQDHRATMLGRGKKDDPRPKLVQNMETEGQKPN